MLKENDNYLNLLGLSHFFEKLKTLFATKNELKDIKVDNGDPGVAGTSAGFGTLTATIDSNVGTPSVEVTASGSNTAKIFNFAFKNLKGEKGDTGATGAKGAMGATGTRGSRWTAGTAITGTSTTATVFSGSGITDALVNDMYLNTSTGYVYKCTTAGAASAAKWVYVGSIKGATGTAGTNATTTAVATTSANGLMGKDMVTRLNLCAPELVQSTEPTTQKKGDSWLQEYT